MSSGEEVILRPSRLRAIARFLFMLAVTGFHVGLVFAYGDCLLLWLLAAVCAAGTLVSLMKVLDRSACLRLTVKGFFVQDRRGPLFYDWRDVQNFRTGQRNRVLFDFPDSDPAARKARMVARFVAGGEGALPDTYGIAADELAKLMNEWRERHLPKPEGPGTC